MDKDGNVLTNCMVDETETFVYDHKNEVITKASFGKPSLLEGTYTMQITVPSSVVDAEGMNFVIGVRQKTNVHQTIESFSYNAGLVGKPTAGGSKTVYGLSSPAFGTQPN
ncbi:MAG: hypothetical protein MJ195_02875 [Mycoplasmoidaceae bacterium]|nr:hypothetical protein [Mycoplasmoidaceae bacterium]